MTGERRQLLLNSAAMLVVGVLQRGMGLVAITCLARVLDPRGLGAYAFTQSTGQVCYGLARLGADAGLHVSVAGLSLRDNKAKVEEALGEGMTIFACIAFCGAAVLLLLSETIATSIFKAPELESFVAVSAVFFVAQVVSQYCYTTLAGMHAFAAYARVITMTSVLVPLLAVTGAFIAGAIGAVWGGAIANLVTAFVLAMRLARKLAWHGVKARLRWPSHHAFTLLSLGFPFFAGGLLLIPVDFLTIGLLSQHSGLDGLGELRATQAFSSIATMLPLALSGPLLSHLAASISVEARSGAMLEQLKAVWVLGLIAVIVLAMFWPFAVSLVFGDAFVLAQTVGVLTLTGVVPMMLLSVLTGALLAARKSQMLFLVGSVQASVLGVATWLLIADHGLVGLLAAQAIGITAGALTAAFSVADQMRGAQVRHWMLPLAVMTSLVVMVLTADAVFAEVAGVRVLVGCVLLLLLRVVVSSNVVTNQERLAIADMACSIRERLSRLARVLMASN